MKPGLFRAVKYIAIVAALFAGETTRRASAAQPPAAGTSILELQNTPASDHQRPDPSTVRTNWRYWESWQSETFKLDSGEIVHADIYRPVMAAKGPDKKPLKTADGKADIELRPANPIQSSPLPPQGWQNPDFDDSAWDRHEGSMTEGYRGVAMVFVRGKFNVPDPAKAGDLNLSLGFRGGIVAYLNGKEVGRAFLPQGKLTDDTLAEPYPKDIYVTPAGALINERTAISGDYSSFVIPPDAASDFSKQFKDSETITHYQQRSRHTDIKIAASALRKGVNVLSLEVHHAPANEIMYKAIANDKEVVQWLSATYAVQTLFLGRVAPGIWWNHAGIENVRLSAAGASPAIVANTSRPKALQVWNESVFKRVLPTQYGDPNEPLAPVKMHGVRNGTCSGEIVVGSSDEIKDLKVTVSDLAGAGPIPASQIEIGYGRWAAYGGWPGHWQYDALDPEAPTDLKPVAKPPWNVNASMGAVAGVVQPVWIVVQVPKDARPGVYTGTITVSAEGAANIQTPVEVHVAGAWAVPDPNQFTTYVGILESPDSVALQYNVPLWSEEHWKRLDKVFEILGQLGNREVYVPLIVKTMLGNEQSMVRWIKQPDGTFKYDFSIVERYIDLAIKHHWNISVTCLALSDGEIGAALWYSGSPRNPPSVTVLDPATKQLSEMPAPKWGTPEAKAFWTPVIQGMQGILKERHIEKTMMFGFVVQRQVLNQTVSDLQAIAPDAKWWEYTHWSIKRKGDPKTGQDAGRMAWAYGTPMAVFWDPAQDAPHYAWKNLAKDVYFVAAPRAKGQINVSETGELSIFRLTSETTLLGSHGGDEIIKEFKSFCGYGEIGADFWPVLPSPTAVDAKRIDSRYVGWGSLSLEDTYQAVIGAGKSAPAPSCRTQLLRESQQEAEARVFVQNALLDETLKAKLGAGLAAKYAKLCDDRTRELFYCTVYFGDNGQDYGRVFNQELWDEQTDKLYLAAADVQKAIGK